MTAPTETGAVPEDRHLHWLRRGLSQPGGKLPLFDEEGQRVDRAVVKACLAAGWAERWFNNPLKPDWVVCRITDAGRAILSIHPDGTEKFRRGDTPQT
jgi:hypothetical protein